MYKRFEVPLAHDKVMLSRTKSNLGRTQEQRSSLMRKGKSHCIEKNNYGNKVADLYRKNAKTAFFPDCKAILLS